MALAQTYYGAKIMLDHLLGRAPYPFPPSAYLGAFTADPTGYGTLTSEVNVGGYARVDISTAMAAADAPSRQIALGSDIAFPPVDAPVAAITHFGVLDTATLGAGNMIWHGSLTTARALGIGEVFDVQAGQFTAGLGLGITRYAAKAWLDHVFGGIAFTQPTPRLALLSASPDDVGSLAAELGGGGYARIDIAALMSDATSPGGQSINTSPIQFAAPTADWPSVEGFCVVDAPTAGNMLLYGAPLAARRIYSGGQPFLIEPQRLVFFAQ